VLNQGSYAVGGFAPDLAARPRRTSGTRVEPEVTPFGELLRGHSGSE
jgi:FMN reductase